MLTSFLSAQRLPLLLLLVLLCSCMKRTLEVMAREIHLAVVGLDNFLEVVSSTAGRGRLTEFGGCSFLSIFDTSREAPAVQPTVAGNKRQKQVLLWYPMAATGRLTCKFIAPAAAFDSGTDGQKRRKMNSSIINQRR